MKVLNTIELYDDNEEELKEGDRIQLLANGIYYNNVELNKICKKGVILYNRITEKYITINYEDIEKIIFLRKAWEGIL